MKCSNCGAELVNGTKFCGECGTKVLETTKCPECGAPYQAGAKFCGECGCKFGVVPSGDDADNGATESEQSTSTVDWNGICTAADNAVPLNTEQAKGIRAALKQAKKLANKGRVLLADDDEFESKFVAFKKLYGERTGFDVDSLPFFADGMVIGMIVNGKNGTGERGTVFTRWGIFILEKAFPVNDGKGDPIGAIIPWKMFYIFGERIDGDLGETCYRLLKPQIVLKSDMVDDEIKKGFREDLDRENGDKGQLLRFGDTGLSADDVEDIMGDMKEALNLDLDEEEEMEEEIEEEEVEEEEEEEEIEEEEEEEEEVEEEEEEEE